MYSFYTFTCLKATRYINIYTAWHSAMKSYKYNVHNNATALYLIHKASDINLGRKQ